MNFWKIIFRLVACLSIISLTRNTDANKLLPFRQHSQIWRSFFVRFLNLAPNHSLIYRHFLVHSVQKFCKKESINNLQHYTLSLALSWEINITEHRVINFTLRYPSNIFPIGTSPVELRPVNFIALVSEDFLNCSRDRH